VHSGEGHKPTIGLILCPGRSKTVTEWALRGIDTPLAVARYTTGEITLTDRAPAELKPALPDLPDLAKELTKTVETAEAVDIDVPDADVAEERRLE
jgi:nuclease YhcG-like protein